MKFATVVTRCICGAAFVLTLAWASPAHAQIGVGEWARTDAEGGGMTMTVAACCKGGYRLTYNVPIGKGQPPLGGHRLPGRLAGGQRRHADRADDVRQARGRPSLHRCR